MLVGIEKEASRNTSSFSTFSVQIGYDKTWIIHRYEPDISKPNSKGVGRGSKKRKWVNRVLAIWDRRV